MSQNILDVIKSDAYNQGITDTLEQLREVYGAGIEETDIWKDTFSQSCGACGQLVTDLHNHFSECDLNPNN